jgi:hypothetical protein
MTPSVRIGAFFLVAALATAWALGAGAAPSKKKGGRPAAPSVQAPSPGGVFKAPPIQRHEPSEARRPTAFSQPARRHEPTTGRDAPVARPGFKRPAKGFVQPGFAPAERPVNATRFEQASPALHRGGKTFRQEPLLRGDQTFVRRTRVDGPAAHHGSNPNVHHGGGQGGNPGRTYHHHHWGHHDYWVYVPFWTYDPWFWGFYFAPFPAPWYYTWVWVGAPWYAAWGWYFEPYPYYAGPSYWVTDYTLSRALEDEYDRGYAAGQESVSGTAISEPIKEQVRVQVDATAKAIQTDQPIALDTALADPDTLFIVDAPLSAATSAGTTCALTGGDIVKAAGPVDPDVPIASVSVVTSKREDCPAGAVVSVSYADLQEMLNSFSESVDDGLHELENQPTPR